MALMDLFVFPLLLVFAVALCPFPKVEESFGTQAAHDAAFVRDKERWDHVEFPGAVRRSFLPATAAAKASGPVVGVLERLNESFPRTFRQILQLPPTADLAKEDAKLLHLIAVRLVLASLVVAVFVFFRNGVHKRYGAGARIAASLLLAVQPHVVYYAARFIPNAYALAASMFAAGCYCRSGRGWALTGGAVMAAVAFSLRCDLVLIGVPYALWCWLGGPRVSLFVGAAVGGAAAAAAVAVSVAHDTPRWLAGSASASDDAGLVWPEGEVFTFNAVEGKSVEWGTSPWHWYATRALPKLLGAAGPLCVLAVLLEWARRGRPAPERRPALDFVPLAIAAAAVACFSLLDHKELRFVLPVVPWVNLTAAQAASAACRSRFGTLVVLGLLALQAAFFGVHLTASRHNYPGATAIAALHARLDDARSDDCGAARVHVGNLAAMTGVTRYSFRGDVEYSKEEGLAVGQLAGMGFTHALAEVPSVPGFHVVHTARAYAGLDLRSLRLRLRDAVFVVERDGWSPSPPLASARGRL